MTKNYSTLAPVISLFTCTPLAQRFIDDPALYALAVEEGCSGMSDSELADMDAYVEQCMNSEQKHYDLINNYDD